MINERQKEIVQYLVEQNFAKVETFAKQFGVSGETIRRDLKKLEEEGYIKRVHGGVLYHNQRAQEKNYDVRVMRNQLEKKAIAREAAGYVEDGDSLAVNAGTSTIELAQELLSKNSLTVVTNSLEIANILTGNTTNAIYLAGGMVRKENGGTVSGELCCEFLSRFCVDKVFLSIGGLSSEYGITEYHVAESMAMRKMAKMGNKVFILADYSKFNEIALNKVCEYKDVDYLFTDWQTPAKEIAACREAGIKVIVAAKQELWNACGDE